MHKQEFKIKFKFKQFDQVTNLQTLFNCNDRSWNYIVLWKKLKDALKPYQFNWKNKKNELIIAEKNYKIVKSKFKLELAKNNIILKE